MAGIVFAVLVVLAASSGAIFKPGGWYAELRKPGWTPPDWAFPVVWTLLYACIGVAGWLVWREVGWSAPIAFWGAQLVFNALWSWMFFGVKRMDWALGDAALLVLSVLGFVVTAQPVSATAAVLFLPYLAWVVTAAALNLRMMQLNPTAKRNAARMAAFS